jgi:hypothetical protein
MKINSCAFVVASEVFDECPLAWNLFCGSDPNCSWGDNNRTLITGNVIRGVLELLDLPEADEEWTEEQKQVEKVFIRLDLLFSLGNLYIDLEN